MINKQKVQLTQCLGLGHMLLILIVLFIYSFDNKAHSVFLQQRNKLETYKFFNFKAFKQIYNKSYNSQLEELIRKKLFHARAFRAFTSTVLYEFYKLDYFLKINENSDWTQEEVENSFISEHTLRDLFPYKTLSEQSYNDNQLLSLIKNNERSTEVENSNFNIDDKDESDYSTLKSLMSGAFYNREEIEESENYEKKSIEPLSNNSQHHEISRPDAVYIDLRSYNCFVSPKNQKKCGACYIFAPIAAYEWLYCRETGKLISFSEQYALDCSIQRMNLTGCGGGSKHRSADFIDKFGLDLSRNYAYRDKNDTCPYDDSIEPKRMGYMRMNEYKREDIEYKDVLNWLRKAPVVLSIAVSDSFQEYGGGVHNPVMDCDHKRGHAMLLVGYGRQDGLEYFLFRNSYGVSFGEQGYYKMNVDSVGCWLKSTKTNKQFAAMVITTPDDYIGNYSMFKVNPDYDPIPVKRRNQEYVHYSVTTSTTSTTTLISSYTDNQTTATTTIYSDNTTLI